MDCKFCEITEGKEFSHKIFENEYVFTFMDKHPINPGHILVIPKKHIPDFYELPSEDYAQLFDAVKRISEIIKEVFNPEKVGLVIAGYDIPHAHVHIIPMHHRDDITSRAYEGGKRSNPSPEELKKSADSIIKSFHQ
jgi:histidine triad (HIT) family protein